MLILFCLVFCTLSYSMLLSVYVRTLAIHVRSMVFCQIGCGIKDSNLSMIEWSTVKSTCIFLPAAKLGSVNLPPS